VLVALALEASRDMQRESLPQVIREVSGPPGILCTSFLTCAGLLRQGLNIDYEGLAGPQDFNQFGDPITTLIIDDVSDNRLVTRGSLGQAEIGALVAAVLALRAERAANQ
jgi:hypothetical protein